MTHSCFPASVVRSMCSKNPGSGFGTPISVEMKM